MSFIKFSKKNIPVKYSLLSRLWIAKVQIQFIIFRGYFKLPGNSKKQEYSEIVILSSQFQLSILSEHSEWFLDGTFWCAPKGFYQLLNIIIFSDKLQKYICLARILLPSKKDEEYIFGLQNLVLSANVLGIKLSPKYIMCDFELGKRQA